VNQIPVIALSPQPAVALIPIWNQDPEGNVRVGVRRRSGKGQRVHSLWEPSSSAEEDRFTP
jgi:hypothetical protein